MEPHSLVLLSCSTVDACHHKHLHGTQTRRVQTVPPRRPLRNLAQGLVRLLPQLGQLSRRLRKASSGTPSGTNAVGARPWTMASDSELSNPSPSCSTVPSPQPQTQHPCQPRSWRTPRWRRAQHTKLTGHAAHYHQGPKLPQAQGHLPAMPGNQHDQLQQGLPQQLEHLQQQERRQQHEQPHQKQQQRQQHQQQQHHLLLEQHPAFSRQRRRGPLRRLLGRLLYIAGRHMRPQGPGENDKDMPERILNIATCGMFFQAGGKIVRFCRSSAARRFGWAFIAVGAIATIYHGSWGRFRPMARKVDYYSIALSSLLLRSAVVGPVPRWLAAVMLVAVPFKPSLVSASNFMAVEVRYLMLAFSHRQLLAQWVAHTAMSVAATACFTLEDTPLLTWFSHTHAAFHVLSASAFLTLPAALNHLMEMLPPSVVAGAAA